MVIYKANHIIIMINGQIVGARIQTNLLHVHFTMVVLYDRCGMSFSKYKKKSPKINYYHG